MSQDIVVCVLVGKWTCLKDGQWKFIMDIDRQGRAITISENMSYDGMLVVIEHTLGVDRKKTSLQLSFGCPQTSNYCTQTRLQPVTLGCASEFRQFRNMVTYNPGMNIFATLTHVMDENGSCENPNDVFDDNGDIRFEESMIALLESMDAAKKAKCRREGRGASSSRKRGRVSAEPISLSTDHDGTVEGRGIPTLPTTTTEVTGGDGDDNHNELLAEAGPTSDNVLFSNQFSDSSALEDLMVDPSPQLDNMVEYHPDEKIRQLPLSANALHVGNVFGSKAELQNALGLYGIEAQFCYKLKKSDKSRLIAVCVDDKCQWRMYAKRHKDSEQFEIRTATIDHTCCVDARARFGEKATSNNPPFKVEPKD